MEERDWEEERGIVKGMKKRDREGGRELRGWKGGRRLEWKVEERKRGGGVEEMYGEEKKGLREGWGGRKQEAAAIATTKAISPSEEQSPNEGRRGPTPASEASARAQVMREMLSLF